MKATENGTITLSVPTTVRQRRLLLLLECLAVPLPGFRPVVERTNSNLLVRRPREHGLDDRVLAVPETPSAQSIEHHGLVVAYGRPALQICEPSCMSNMQSPAQSAHVDLVREAHLCCLSVSTSSNLARLHLRTAMSVTVRAWNGLSYLRMHGRSKTCFSHAALQKRRTKGPIGAQGSAAAGPANTCSLIYLRLGLGVVTRHLPFGNLGKRPNPAMASAIAHSSPGRHDSHNLFDVQESHLASIVDFNSSFPANPHAQDGIDPRLTISNASPSAFSQDGFEAALSPDPKLVYPQNFSSSNSTPYFTSAPDASSLVFEQSFLRNEFLHRRSVSEPPDGFALHQHRPLQHALIPRAGPDAPVVFHRNGQELGTPTRSSHRNKNAQKPKYHRAVPYPPHPVTLGRTTNPRAALRRTCTQPVHAGRSPTSAPSPMTHPSLAAVVHTLHSHPIEPSPAPQHFVASRTCTPEPQLVYHGLDSSSAHSPALDPSLDQRPSPKAAVSGEPSHVLSAVGSPRDEVIVLKLGVDEFRSMIVNAVHKALHEEKTLTTAQSAVLPDSGGDEQNELGERVAGWTTVEDLDVPEDIGRDTVVSSRED